MSEKKEDVKKAPETEEQQYSLNDDRRVKVLSPGALEAQRFFRNRVAVTGLVILAFMFLFSFVGGVISPYKEDQIFYRTEAQNQQYAGVTENTDFRYSVADGQSFDSVCQAQFLLATIQGNDTFTARDTEYTYAEMGEDFYADERFGGNVKYLKDGAFPIFEALPPMILSITATATRRCPLTSSTTFCWRSPATRTLSPWTAPSTRWTRTTSSMPAGKRWPTPPGMWSRPSCPTWC